jgi:CheY-like chemotaxis protein
VDICKKKKVLIVDDEMSIRRLIGEILKKQFDVIEVQNGIEAVEAAHSQHPDIIVMDLIMPMMDGVTACAEIRRDTSTSDIPVVMLTSIDHFLNRNLAKNAGVDRYLTKPFDKRVLLSTIAELLDKKMRTSDALLPISKGGQQVITD